MRTWYSATDSQASLDDGAWLLLRNRSYAPGRTDLAAWSRFQRACASPFLSIISWHGTLTGRDIAIGDCLELPGCQYTMSLVSLNKLMSVALVATTVLSADPPTCNGISATRRTVGYYDTNYAGTECGKSLWTENDLNRPLRYSLQASTRRRWSPRDIPTLMLHTHGLTPTNTQSHT